ncbi:MAG TPA: PAS domain S-box protein [Opitutaceae bacterium]|nr:PAS domain S-box protein [Opitutaceae bacterium]
MKPPLPFNEEQRVLVLRNLSILDTPPEPELDSIAELAAQICDTPISLISFIDESRQWIKSKFGLMVDQISRDVSFCAHALAGDDLMVIPDASKDERFAGNPMVKGDPMIRFYAGAPLVTSGGEAIGTLCVMDRVPRQLTDRQQRGLRALSRLVMNQIELRHEILEQKRKIAVERDRKEKELSLLETCISRLNDIVIITDAEPVSEPGPRIQYVNDAFVRRTGYSREEVIGKSPRFLQGPKTQRDALDRIGAALKEWRPVREELINYKKSGEEFWLDLDIVPVADATGWFTHWIAIERDITERKQAEDERDRLFKLSLDMLCVSGFDGRFEQVNPAWTQCLGWTEEELLSRPVLDFVLPADREATLGSREKLKQGNPSRGFENRYLCKDGSVRWLSWNVYPLKESRKVFGVARDVTERKRAEEKLREQAALLDKAQDAIMVRDLDHRIVYWNKSAERLYGWRSDEILGRSARDLIHANPAAFDDAFEALLAKREWTGELTELNKNGESFLIEGRWTLMRDGAGKPHAVLAINTDITRRKRVEQQLLRAQRMESIGTLAGGIAHDINNVLTPIMMSVGLLKLDVKDPATLTLLASIGRSAEKGAEMVRQVVSFARGMEGKRIEVQFRHIVTDLIKTASDTFPENIRIEERLSPNLWTLQADPTQIHQVLFNLCLNARDAMPDGGQITVSAENIMIDASYAAMNIEAKVGPYLKIEVEDSGPGIPKAIIDKIFDPFFTTKDLDYAKGKGLGLSISLAIVKGHGGFIRAYSDPGRGARFRIYLPATVGSANPPGERTDG